MRALASRSFDQHGRYTPVWEIRQQLDLPVARILDVGDPAGVFGALFPDDRTVSLDLFAMETPPIALHSRVIGSGFELPFADDSFDLVASHDAFEHLPAGRRHEFVAELIRVSRGPVVLVAPFNDPGTVLCESLVNAYFVSRVAQPIDALEEHAEFGLPDLDDLVAFLDASNVQSRVFGDGWLYHWLAFYFLRAHLTAAGETARITQADALFNEHLVELDHSPPHYRRVVVINGPTEVGTLRPAGALESGVEDLLALTALAADLARLLVPGDEPWSPGSQLGAYLGHPHDNPVLGAVSQSLSTVLEGMRTSPLQVASGTEPSARPSVTVVVLDTAGDGATKTVASLASVGGDGMASEPVVVVARTTEELSAGVQEVAAASSSDCLAFVSGDVTVSPGWLAELVSAFEPAAGYVCVAGTVHDAVSGQRAELSANVFGQPSITWVAPDAHLAPPSDVLFAPLGAMLIDRRSFLSAGGLDPDMDPLAGSVDLGWRLWVTGYRVRRAPAAKVIQFRESVAPAGDASVERDYSALRAVIKNLDDTNLAAFLGPTLLLQAARLPADTAGGRVTTQLESLLKDRAQVQAARRRSDADVLRRFDRPFATDETDLVMLSAQRHIVEGFGLELVANSQRALRVLVVADAPHSQTPVDRAGVFADALSVSSTVVVAAPKGDDVPGWGGAVYPFRDGDELASLFETADLAIVSAGTLAAYPELAATDAILVVDLAGFSVELDVRRAGEIFLRGDFFVCASDRERDYWFGVIAGQGLSGRLHPDDPGSWDLLGVVPLGGRESVASLHALVAEPWKWRQRARKRFASEDLQILVTKRDDEIVALRDELDDAQRRKSAEVGQLTDEIDRLRRLNHDLQGAVAVWEKRSAWVRRIPGFRVVRRLRRTTLRREDPHADAPDAG